MKPTYKTLYRLLSSATLIVMAGVGTAKAADAVEPYVYCSKDSCRTTRGPALFFFGQLPNGVKNHCVTPHTYAMTFDDGPAASYPKVLEILERQGVKATFFINGNKLSGETEQAYLKQAAAAGHQISNHTFSHRDLIKSTDAEIVEEVKANEDAIVRVLGDTPKVRADAQVVRPPFGYVDQRVFDLLLKNGNTVVRWNSDRSDWELNEGDTDLEMKRLDQHLAYAAAQNPLGVTDSIIDLNHDFSPATLSQLDIMIDRIKAKGYRFVKLDECLGI